VQEMDRTIHDARRHPPLIARLPAFDFGREALGKKCISAMMQ
jgi:hypothetical protein